MNQSTLSVPTDTSQTRHVVIAGAGPGGVLAAILLLHRNSTSSIQYHVTLIDDRDDYSKVTLEELSQHRSWMIGLACHGLTAIREVPGLFENYIAKVGVHLQSFSIHLGTKEMKSSDTSGDNEGYIVDRNYVVWALTNYLGDTFGTRTKQYQPRYNTKVLYIDSDNRRLLVRKGSIEEYLNYDIILGCDGIRSVVRNAIQQKERFFECRVSDIFNKFKAVHVEQPNTFDSGSMHLLPACLPNCNGIALPERGASVNISIGFYRHQECEKQLQSDDPKIVAAYMEKHFKATKLVDYDDFARQWCNQPWNSTGQVHCNFYHSEKVGAIIMGDAAHATSPSIGMGMNTALSDAAVLNRLLDEYKDNWVQVLPAFSKERVKEGRALTDLAFYLFSMNKNQALKHLVVGLLRSTLTKFFPTWVWPDPQQDIGSGTKLSVVYERATKMGILSAVRRTNDTLRQQYEDETLGMVTYDKPSCVTNTVAIIAAVCVAGLAYAWR